jgi:hypothetical protein
LDGAVVVTTMDTSVGAVTVITVDPLTVPEVAVIVTVPAVVAVATFRFVVPVVGKVAAPPLNVVALQVGDVSAKVVPSLYVPVAVKGSVVPAAIDGVAGVTAIEMSEAALTVKLAGVVAVTLPNAALIVPVRPMAASELVARPAVVVLIVTPPNDDVHVTPDVRF